MAYYLQITLGNWQTSFDWVPPPTRAYWDVAMDAFRWGKAVPFPPGVVSEAAVTKSKRRELPDFVVVNGAMCISPRLRNHIEMLEPGRNQFVPFMPLGRGRAPYLGPDGEPIRYYLLQVTERIDAVDIARSAPSRIVIPPKYWVLPEDEKVVMRKSIISDHHVWAGRLHMPENVFFSDTLGDWVITHKMKGMEMVKVEESED
jgi:hypothetical protein